MPREASDPVRGTVVKQCVCKTKKQNLKTLMQSQSLNCQRILMLKKMSSKHSSYLKEYFDKVNKVLAPKAQGMHHFMYKLTEEFCRKHNRHDSLLLDWNKGKEDELYRKSVVSLKSLKYLAQT